MIDRLAMLYERNPVVLLEDFEAASILQKSIFTIPQDHGCTGEAARLFNVPASTFRDFHNDPYRLSVRKLSELSQKVYNHKLAIVFYKDET